LRELGDDLASSIPWVRTYCEKYAFIDIERALTDLGLDLLAADADRRETLLPWRQEIITFLARRLCIDTVTLANLQKQVEQVLLLVGAHLKT
jgi:hypothetical protein